jgi:hypothetical protein
MSALRQLGKSAPAVRIESGYMGETWLCTNHALMAAAAVAFG